MNNGEDMKKYEPIVPKKKWFKELVAKIVFLVLGRAFQSAARLDPLIKREVAEWKDGFVLVMRVLPSGPVMVLKKINGEIRHMGGKLPENFDITINFKNIECAFLVLTPQIGAAQAFAENRLSVAGDLVYAVAFTRCLNVLLTYLYPLTFITKRILKRIPPMSFIKFGRIIYIYCLGIPFGI